MFQIKIDTSDLEQKIGRLDGPVLAREIAKRVADEAVLPELAKYPAQRHAKQPFKSAQSRRFFFAALKRGQITVPYQRSGKLGTEWTRQQDGNGLTLTSTRPYSDLVRTRGKQSPYHAGNWPTTDDIAQKIEGDTAEIIGTATVIDLLQRAGLT
jgi:hypothetical protein